MRILLISPPFYRLIGFYSRYFPIGLTMLAAALKKNGHDVKVYDADVSARSRSFDYSRLPDKYPEYLRAFREAEHPVWREMERTIADERPDVIGISVYTTFAASALHVAALSRKVLPSCTVVAGGPHVTVMAEETLRVSPDIDYAVRGRGEDPLVSLASFLEGKTRDIASVAGLSWREGAAVRHTPAGNTADNAALSCPDRSLLMQEKAYTSEDMGLVMTTRGCPYRCAFCASDNRRVSYRPVAEVIEEMRAVKEKYGTRQFTIKDDSFTVNPQRVAEFCAALKRSGMNIRWECNTRVGLVTEPLLRAMKAAGCNFIKIGIESGSERVLKKMNKGITVGQIRETARLLKKAGIHWTGYFLMGVPGETEEDIYLTLDLMREIKPDMALLGVYEPFPGTEMFGEGVARGTIKPSMTRDEYFSTLPNHYYKRDPRSQTDVVDTERFSRLEQEMKRTFHEHNTRFGNVCKMAAAKSGVYLGHPGSLLADIKRYVSYKGTP